MSNDNQRPWYKNPIIIIPAIAVIIAAIIGGIFVLIGELPKTPTNPTFEETGGDIDADGDYEISWVSSRRASSYILQEDSNPSFTSPRTIFRGDGIKATISAKNNGDYYYRVRACNDAGDSEWSPLRKITVIISTAPTPESTPTPEITLTPLVTQIPIPLAPAITIEELIPDDIISGKVTGVVDPSKYKVAVYVKTDIWYIHPYIDSFASISSDGSWEIETVQRYPAPTRICTFLVEKDYKAPDTIRAVSNIPSLAQYCRSLE